MKTPCLERTVDQHGNGRCSVKVRLAVHHDDVNRLFQAVHNDILANGQSHATKNWWHGIGVKQGFDTLIKVDPSLLLKTLAKSPSNGRVRLLVPIRATDVPPLPVVVRVPVRRAQDNFDLS